MAMSIIPQTLGTQIAARMDYLKTAGRDWAGTAELLATLTQPQDATAALKVLHRLQRVNLALKLDLLDHPAIMAAIDGDDFPLWDRYTALETTPEKRHALAKLMYEGDVQRRTPILLNISDYSRDIAELILEQCVANGDETNVMISDPLFQRRLMTHCDTVKAAKLAELMMEPYHHYERAITIRIEQVQQPYPDAPVSADIQQIYNAAVNAQQAHIRSKFYTLTCLPTPKDTEMDQIPYADYIDLFFRMCDVDWSRVDAAHQTLIKQLDAAKTLRFTNNDGTDFSVDVDGFTFCNSLVAKNVPGSEVFSAPRINSANGIVVGKGRYLFRGKLMENITLKFESGRIVEYAAEKGHDVLTEMIETDEGSHYIGEIAIGTNPVLRTHLVNGLLVEKIGGSFHFAIGYCYKFTDYNGAPVKVDNGNISTIHEDMTIMLHGKQGRIYVDDVMIMDDGNFIDPRLSYLNGQ